MTTNMEEDNYEEIQEDIGFFDPTPDDTLGIAMYLPKFVPFERQKLATLIAHQGQVGTVFRNQLPDDKRGDTLFGFISAINIGYHRSNSAISSLIEWMRGLHNTSLDELLAGDISHIGILFNERAFGIPNEFSPHIIRSITKEILWAQSDFDDADFRNSFKFTHLIMFMKTMKDGDEILYATMEHELFFQRASFKVEVPSTDEEGDLEGIEYHRYIVVIEYPVMDEVRAELHAAFGLDEASFIAIEDNI